MEYAPRYDKRRATHIVSRDHGRLQGKECWPIRGIRYDGGLAKECPASVNENGVTLEGIESVIYKQLMNVLAEKKGNCIDSVIALDFGGMYGIPFIRLAKSTEDLVRRGKIAYVVSNLIFNPAIMSDEEVRSFSGLNHSDYNNFFLKNRGLVHFITSDADELKSIKINLPNKGIIPLYKNIDIIHEDNALGKSQLLDSDLPALGESLSPQGVFFLGDRDANLTINPRAFKLGVRNLLQGDIRKVNLDDHSQYDVYVKPKAPKLIVTSSS